MNTLIVTVVVIGSLIGLLAVEWPPRVLGLVQAPRGSVGRFFYRYRRQIRHAFTFACGVILAYLVGSVAISQWLSFSSWAGAWFGIGAGWITIVVFLAICAIGWRYLLFRPSRTKLDQGNGYIGPANELAHPAGSAPIKWWPFVTSSLLACAAISGAAAFDPDAFRTVRHWASLFSSPSAATANISAEQPSASEAIPEEVMAQEIEAALVDMSRTIRTARAAKVKIVTEIDTPEARERLASMPNLIPSHKAWIAEQQQFIEQARGYAELAFTLIADSLPSERDTIDRLLQEMAARPVVGEDLLTVELFRALRKNAASSSGDDFVSASMVAWAQTIELPQVEQLEVKSLDDASRSAEPLSGEQGAQGGVNTGAATKARPPAEPRWKSGSARDRLEQHSRIRQMPADEFQREEAR